MNLGIPPVSVTAGMTVPRLGGILLLICGALLLGGCRPVSINEIHGQTMGTTWSLHAVGINTTHQRQIQDQLDHWEAIFSHWRKESPMSRFNDHTSTEWQAVPLELVQVIQLAHRIGQETDGALDITVGSAVESLGFGPPGHSAAPTSQSLLGWHLIEWRDHPPALRKKKTGMRLHVGAMVEGWVMDKLIQSLLERGLRDFLLEIGGEVAAIGHAPDGAPWQVGIQSPEGGAGETLEQLPLSNLCIATSGSYRHRYEKEGRTYTHLVDPRNGESIAHSLVSVSVIHPSCAMADGYATALMILGPQKGREVADKLGLRVFWIEER